MAKRTKSGLKRRRQAVKRTARNQAVRSSIRTLVKRARQATDPASQDVRAALRTLDSAARKGIIHPNVAALRKSRLIRQAARAQAATPA